MLTKSRGRSTKHATWLATRFDGHECPTVEPWSRTAGEVGRRWTANECSHRGRSANDSPAIWTRRPDDDGIPDLIGRFEQGIGDLETAKRRRGVQPGGRAGADVCWTDRAGGDYAESDSYSDISVLSVRISGIRRIPYIPYPYLVSGTVSAIRIWYPKILSGYPN